MNDLNFARVLAVAIFASATIGTIIGFLVTAGSLPIAFIVAVSCLVGSAAALSLTAEIAHFVTLRRANARAAAHALAHEPGSSGGANLGLERQALREARQEAVQQDNAQDPVQVWLQQQIAQAESYVQNARQQRALQQQERTHTQQRSLHRSNSLDLPRTRARRNARDRSLSI